MRLTIVFSRAMNATLIRPEFHPDTRAATAFLRVPFFAACFARRCSRAMHANLTRPEVHLDYSGRDSFLESAILRRLLR